MTGNGRDRDHVLEFRDSNMRTFVSATRTLSNR